MPVVPVVTSATVPFGHISGANEKYVKPGDCRRVPAWVTSFWWNPENTFIEVLCVCVCVFETYFVCIVQLHYPYRTTRVDRAPNLFFSVGPDTF